MRKEFFYVYCIQHLIEKVFIETFFVDSTSRCLVGGVLLNTGTFSSSQRLQQAQRQNVGAAPRSDLPDMSAGMPCK